jgi:hypothetical protein
MVLIIRTNTTISLYGYAEEVVNLKTALSKASLL